VAHSLPAQETLLESHKPAERSRVSAACCATMSTSPQSGIGAMPLRSVTPGRILNSELEQEAAREDMRFAVVSLILVLGVTACGSGSLQQSLSGTESSHPQSSAGSAVLNWDPVTEDTSGNTLEGLAGYKIHYGTSVEAMDTVEVLSDPSQTTYIVYGLSPGTWYFAASAYTSDGTESGLSDVASKTID